MKSQSIESQVALALKVRTDLRAGKGREPRESGQAGKDWCAERDRLKGYYTQLRQTAAGMGLSGY